ncbi:MAG: YhgE/Pip family protein [Sporolactobacillus sp.]
MNLVQLIVAELKAIIAKPHNIIVMVAVMCVPLLYAGMFLYSFWDAFGETGKLPVAIVNQDQGAKIAGKTLNAGSDLVKELKHNKNFKWKFVNERTAEDGFHNNHYFMIVRIPSSFSRNATTMADQQLKPVHLNYRLNADYNFIASRMADAGVKELRTRVSSEITKTYANSMYQQLDKLTIGLNKASKGSKDLAKGSKREVKGLNQLKSGFKALANGTNRLKRGAGQLANGATQLNSGAGTLNNGIKQYTGAVSNRIVPGSKQLTSGLNQLNNGMQSQNLNGQVNQLNSGMQQFATSISGLQAKLSASINPQNIGQSAGKAINAEAIGNQAVQTAEAKGLKAQTADSAATIAKSVTGTIGSTVTSQNTKDAISQGIQNNETIKNSLEPTLIAAVMRQNGVDKQTATGIVEKQLNALAVSVADQTTNTINMQIQSNTNTISSSLQQPLLTRTEEAIGSTASQTAQQVAPQVAEQTASQIKSGIVSGLNQKDPQSGQTLSSAANQLAAGTSQLASKNGIPLITSSVSQAAQGAQQLNSGLNQLNSNSSQLTSGSSALATGAGTLSSGAKTLYSNFPTLSNGQQRLASGTNQLSDGAQKIYNGNSNLGGSLSSAHAQLAKTPTNNAHAEKFAEPVKGVNQSHQAVDTFGSGFAPYFISLGLYVGALLLTIIYDLGRPTESGIAKNGWTIALSKFFVTFLMSVGQSLLVDVVALKGLGLQVSSVPTFIGFTILTSMSFMAIIEWLAGSFNNEGRFACIVILILQLVSSGGAYAIDLIPHWLQGIAHFLPMTYSVNGFRNVIDGHQPHLLAFNTMILWFFVIGALILSLLTFSIKFERKMKEYRARNQEDQPSIES